MAVAVAGLYRMNQLAPSSTMLRKERAIQRLRAQQLLSEKQKWEEGQRRRILEEKSATKIQASARKKLATKRTEDLRTRKKLQQEAEDAAALKIQSIYRSLQARRKTEMIMIARNPAEYIPITTTEGLWDILTNVSSHLVTHFGGFDFLDIVKQALSSGLTSDFSLKYSELAGDETDLDRPACVTLRMAVEFYWAVMDTPKDLMNEQRKDIVLSIVQQTQNENCWIETLDVLFAEFGLDEDGRMSLWQFKWFVSDFAKILHLSEPHVVTHLTWVHTGVCELPPMIAELLAQKALKKKKTARYIKVHWRLWEKDFLNLLNPYLSLTNAAASILEAESVRKLFQESLKMMPEILNERDQIKLANTCCEYSENEGHRRTEVRRYVLGRVELSIVIEMLYKCLLKEYETSPFSICARLLEVV